MGIHMFSWVLVRASNERNEMNHEDFREKAPTTTTAPTSLALVSQYHVYLLWANTCLE